MIHRMPLWAFLLLLPIVVAVAPTDQRLATLGGGVLVIALALGWVAIKRAWSNRGIPRAFR